MTGREFTALSFRILGVVILLVGLSQAVFTLFAVAQQVLSGLFWVSMLGFLIPMVLFGLIALPLIFHSESLVARLFPESEATIALAVSRRDLLMCGLALVGAWLLATNLPYLARLTFEVLWSAEGTRRAEVDPTFLSLYAFDALGALLVCVVAGLVFRHSGSITDWWESKTQGRRRRSSPSSATRQ